ncbi:MAG: kinase [Rhodanobacteraceae bacterium]
MGRNGTGYSSSLVERLIEEILRREGKRTGSLLIGLSGLQGSGKSTLARQLVDTAADRDIEAIEMSIDDFYLTRQQRRQLARTVHPLLATRGVPGTHDLGLLAGTLAAVRQAAPEHPARLPEFDKGRDGRLPISRWRSIATPPRWIILEGWCVGIPAESSAALSKPCNALEHRRDADGYWRRWINARLATDYRSLWARFDALIALQAPDFDIVRTWREEPERELRKHNAPGAMSRSELRQFLMFYERLSRQALRAMPGIADITIAIDHQRQVRSVKISGDR